MEAEYELRLENFTGPLEKLLELIEEKQLEITQVSLAAVTEDFLKYLGVTTASDLPEYAELRENIMNRKTSAEQTHNE